MQKTQENYQQFNTTSICYFYVQDNQKCQLPIIKNHYDVKIINNFAEIRSIQTYSNPFSKPLQIHYQIPVDPTFCLNNLIVKYQNLTLQGTVKQRQKVKAEYKIAKQKGQTVMMAQNSQLQKSILKIKIGNIEPNESVNIQYTLIGQLSIQKANHWTLHIPSHIGPRYQRLQDFIKSYFKQLWSNQPKALQTYLKTKTEWSFGIHLICNQKILQTLSTSHQIKQQKISDFQKRFMLDEEKLPQKDLEFTFTTQNPLKSTCTVGDGCACISLFLPNNKEQNFQKYNGQYIFVLDRSGSMGGARIKNAINALVLFLKSLPEQSKFNIISFGSKFQRLFPKSVQYTNQNILSAISQIQTFTASMGGTQIAEPLKDIMDKQNSKSLQTQKHIIVLTDGQVQNTQAVIQLIKKLKQDLNIRTHMVGIGNGVSMDMIKRGSQFGGGQHIFINKIQQMKKQIIHLLFKMTAEQLKQFSIVYNEQFFQTSYPLIPSVLKKGVEHKFFFRLKHGFKKEQIQKQNIKITYLDEVTNKQGQVNLKINNRSYLKQLNKYATYLEIQDLLKQGNKQKEQQALKKSIQAQVLCRKTAYICRIKENQESKINEPYLLKMKNALQGFSKISSQFGTVYVMTLTGKSIQFDTSMGITVYQLKQIVCEEQGIPPGQQRMVFAGKQLSQSDKTLEQYGVGPQCTIHLVLRLRGGADQTLTPGQISKNKGYKLVVMTQNLELSITIQLKKQIENCTVLDVYKAIYQKHPQLKGVNFDLKLSKNNIILQKQKKLTDYQISQQQNVIGSSISHYYLLSQELVKLMQIQGYWIYDQKIVQSLNLTMHFNEGLKMFNQNKDKAMTRAILQFLKLTFSKQKQELSLVFKKVEKYLASK